MWGTFTASADSLLLLLLLLPGKTVSQVLEGVLCGGCLRRVS